MSVTLSVEYKDFMVDCKEVENTTLTITVGQYSQFNFSVQAGTIILNFVFLLNLFLANGLDFDCDFGTAFLEFNKTLSTVLLEDTITCNANPSTCMTIGGNVPYSNCTFPFINDGREFQACTDVNHPGSDTSQ